MDAPATFADAHGAADASAAGFLMQAEELALRGDHEAARRLLAGVIQDPTAPEPVRREAAAFRRELGPDPLAVTFGLLGFAAIVAVWVMSLPG